MIINHGRDMMRQLTALMPVLVHFVALAPRPMYSGVVYKYLSACERALFLRQTTTTIAHCARAFLAHMNMGTHMLV